MARVILGPEARPLRRTLRPIEWVVLEEVALDAVVDTNGRLVAATSSRQVAEHLGLTPGAVARALAHLRELGLLDHVRQPGPAGRFGLSAYVVGAIPGLVIEAVRPSDPADGTEGPCAPGPGMEPPGLATPEAAGPSSVHPGAEGPCPARPCVVAPQVAEGAVVSGRSTPAESTARRRGRAAPSPIQLNLLGSHSADVRELWSTAVAKLGSATSAHEKLLSSLSSDDAQPDFEDTHRA